ncbi:hypothetical protein PQX77_001772 [Marasmius sp. AFHP31]|nr:hypothetical protein PQX77_001772 [Marasmius sp. AFHP31]
MITDTQLHTHIRLVPRLPMELVAIVINASPFNRRFLSRCSLVCREWLSIARPVLFSCIYLDISKLPLLPKLCRILNFDHSNTRLQYLNLKGAIHPYGCTFPSDLNVDLLGSFPFSSNAFQHVHSLRLFNVIFPSIRDMVNVVCQFSSLRTLFIRYQLYPSNPSPFQVHHSHTEVLVAVEKLPKSLQSLTIDARNVSLASLSSLVASLAPRIRSYQIQSIRSEDLAALKAFVVAAGSFGPDGQSWDLEFQDLRADEKARLHEYIDLPHDNGKVVRLGLDGLEWMVAVALLSTFGLHARESGLLESITLPDVRVRESRCYQEDLGFLDRVIDSVYFGNLRAILVTVVLVAPDVERLADGFGNELEKLRCGALVRPRWRVY